MFEVSSIESRDPKSFAEYLDKVSAAPSSDSPIAFAMN